MSQAERVAVKIYSRVGCHLCEVAEKIIRRSECSDEIELQIINIDEDPELKERYTNDVPVIVVNGDEVARHRISPSDFCRHVRQRKKS